MECECGGSGLVDGFRWERTKDYENWRRRDEVKSDGRIHRFWHRHHCLPISGGRICWKHGRISVRPKDLLVSNGTPVTQCYVLLLKRRNLKLPSPGQNIRPNYVLPRLLDEDEDEDVLKRYQRNLVRNQPPTASPAFCYPLTIFSYNHWFHQTQDAISYQTVQKIRLHRDIGVGRLSSTKVLTTHVSPFRTAFNSNPDGRYRSVKTGTSPLFRGFFKSM